MDDMFAMKLSEANLATTFAAIPHYLDIGRFAFALMHMNAKGETCYLIRKHGADPFEPPIHNRLVRGSDLRYRFTYEPAGDGTTTPWFPIHPRT